MEGCQSIALNTEGLKVLKRPEGLWDGSEYVVVDPQRSKGE